MRIFPLIPQIEPVAVESVTRDNPFYESQRYDEKNLKLQDVVDGEWYEKHDVFLEDPSDILDADRELHPDSDFFSFHNCPCQKSKTWWETSFLRMSMLLVESSQGERRRHVHWQG